MKPLDILDIALHLLFAFVVAGAVVAIWLISKQHWLVAVGGVVAADLVALWFWNREYDQYEEKYGTRLGWAHWSLQKKLEAAIPGVTLVVVLPLVMTAIAWRGW